MYLYCRCLSVLLFSSLLRLIEYLIEYVNWWTLICCNLWLTTSYKIIVHLLITFACNCLFSFKWVVFYCSLQECVPENVDGVREFEAPPSPDSSYNNSFPRDEDFAKDPVVVPPQLQMTVLDTENIDEGASSSPKPQHVVLDHLFIEKGWASQSVLSLGLTHRFQSKYVTVVLYKPLKRWALTLRAQQQIYSLSKLLYNLLLLI